MKLLINKIFVFSIALVNANVFVNVYCVTLRSNQCHVKTEVAPYLYKHWHC